MINCPGSGLVRFFHFFFSFAPFFVLRQPERRPLLAIIFINLFFSLSLSPRQPIIYYIHYINNVSFRLSRLVSTFHVKMKKTRKPAFLGYHFFFFSVWIHQDAGLYHRPSPHGPFRLQPTTSWGVARDAVRSNIIFNSSFAMPNGIKYFSPILKTIGECPKNKNYRF